MNIKIPTEETIESSIKLTSAFFKSMCLMRYTHTRVAINSAIAVLKDIMYMLLSTVAK